jgi:hypothetical protein
MFALMLLGQVRYFALRGRGCLRHKHSDFDVVYMTLMAPQPRINYNHEGH